VSKSERAVVAFGCTCESFFRPLLVVLTNEFNKVCLVTRSPEKAGVGGSIPSLATSLNGLESTLTCLFFRLCQICGMDFPDQNVLTRLVFRRPFGVVAADCGGAVGEDGCNLLDRSTLP